MALVLEAQRQFARAANMEQLKAFFLEESQRLGFDSFVYALRIPTNFSNAQVIMLDGYPEGWVKRYFEAAYYESDPVMAWCISEILPIRWSDLVLEPGSAAESMMLEAAEYGLRDGVTMPVHSPQGELGILSLSLDAPLERARAIIERALPIVQLLANHLHQAVRRLGGLPQEAYSSLTMRERECLTWVADGKTSNEIAQLLGISENTVNFHLNNAMQKLDVVNRQHAVGKASLQRLIQPKPF
ncbi:MAG: LuxR family transcriptional regulator [Methylophilaceae bacterium]|nr:LuxR family transcriptional regulator [Methylophilaceae bacterium]